MSYFWPDKHQLRPIAIKVSPPSLRMMFKYETSKFSKDEHRPQNGKHGFLHTLKLKQTDNTKLFIVTVNELVTSEGCNLKMSLRSAYVQYMLFQFCNPFLGKHLQHLSCSVHVQISGVGIYVMTIYKNNGGEIVST